MGAIHAHHGLLLGSAGAITYRSRLQFGGADASTTFTDDTGKTWAAFGNAQIDTSLGDQRGLFDGSGDYITTPNHADLVFGSGDFRIVFGQRYNSKSGFQTIISKGYASGQSPTNTGWLIQTGNGNGLINIYSQLTSSTLLLGEPALTINTGQDYLMEVGRLAGTLYIKRDGSTVASTSNSVNFNNAAEVVVGSGGSATYTSFGFNGWLKDLQIL